MRSFRLQAAVALAAALLAPAAPAGVWQWTDAEGVVRYTPNPDRVPESQRGSLIKLEPGMQAPAPRASQPPVRYAPAEELPRGADPFAAPEPARTLETPEAGPAAAPETEPTVKPAPAPTSELPAQRAAKFPTPPAPGSAPVETPAPRPAAAEAPASLTPPVEAPPPRAAAAEAPASLTPPVEAPPPRAAAAEAPAPLTPPVEAPAPRAASVAAAVPQALPGEEPEPPPAPRPLSDTERARRAQLEEQIAADEETLKELISKAPGGGDEPLRESAELREIARRLPALQAELRALEGVPEQRGKAAAPKP